MLWNLLYAALLIAASPMILYRSVTQGRYRRGGLEKLLGLSSQNADQITGGKPSRWIHAVSVGEINLLPSVVERLTEFDPTTPIAISTSTDTGYDLAVKLFGPQRVFFCPLDFSWAVKRTLRSLRCKELLLVELELWPNLIAAAKHSGATVTVINARLSERSGRGYARAGRFTRPTFSRLDRVLCGTDGDAERFIQCGVAADRVSVTGSIKFDNAPHDRGDAAVQELSDWCGVDPWQQIWIAGSTAPGEEAMVISVYRQLRETYPALRLVIVPRHKQRFDAVAHLITDAGLNVRRQSRGDTIEHNLWENDTIVLGDTIGHLKHWWGVGTIAFVGGSFGDRGGQNMLEPAGYGSAVSFGPNTKNFRDIARGLITAHAAARVHNESEMRQFVHQCLDDPITAETMGRNATRVVDSHRGAIDRTIDQILGPHERFIKQAA